MVKGGKARTPQARVFAVLVSTLLLGLMASGALVWRGSEAIFTASTSNAGNSWTSGTVNISDNDGGSGVLFSLTNLVPGNTATRCITVNYTGSVAATVKLYALSSPTNGLAPEIKLTIDVVNTDPGDDTNWGVTCPGGAVTNVFPTATLASFNQLKFDYTTGVTGWAPTGPNQRRVFKITALFDPNSAMQGASASTTFQWEARA